MHTVNVPLPNAQLMSDVSHIDVTALVGLILRTTSEPGPEGRKTTLDHLAKALGVSRGAIYTWTIPKVKRPGVISSGRNIPYASFFCLQLWATNPAATRADVFEPMWAEEAAQES